MIRRSSEQIAFEKSRKDILKMSGKDIEPRFSGKEEEQRYAWEIELEEYRSRKKLNRFLIAGAVCGFISLFISAYVLYIVLSAA